MMKNLPAVQETWEMWVQSLGQKDPWRRAWQPTPVLLPGESHELRSLAGYSPWGHKESDRAGHTPSAVQASAASHRSSRQLC